MLTAAHRASANRYWILLSLTDSGVEVTFHHPLGSHARKYRTTILTHLRLGLRSIARRVNQLLLLYQLHETREASPLILVRHTHHAHIHAYVHTCTASPSARPRRACATGGCA